jgi:FlaA1/EpsC-like NDP-sugar epimerase
LEKQKDKNLMKIKYKQIGLVLADIAIVIFSYWCAAFLRYEGAIPKDSLHQLTLYTAISIFVTVIFSIIFDCYGGMWQYAGFETMLRQSVVSVLSIAVLLIIKYTLINIMSGSISVIYGILIFILTSGIRIMTRFAVWFKSSYITRLNTSKRAVIIGGGSTGAMIIKRARDAQNSNDFNPVAVVDNDPKKIGLKLCGVKVVGGIDSIENICKTYRAEEIIIAIPSATKEELYDIFRKCIKTNLPMRFSPNFADVKNYLQKDKVALKNVTLEDLLFRNVIEHDMTDAKEFISGRVVMVTGGAGSIGSELCRQALSFGCSLLIIYDFSENGLFEINEELKHKFDTDKYKLCLGSVRDVSRLDEVIKKYNPYVVFHAAAHKHVPMMELNPFEAIKNNVSGTMNVINSCIENSVKKFILISTDKAVNPANIMGASKRIAELIVKNMNNRGTELAAVRFGNVLGSNGSVIPTFKRQIETGGPVTLTHKDITRYFMTIPEAVSLVLTAGTFAKGGEIYVLDMGQPIKIYDLAADLIRLSGYEPGVDIQIEVVGLRPGEKLYEELFLNDETVDKTSHEKIFILKSGNADNFDSKLNNIINIADQEQDEELLREAVFGLADDNYCPKTVIIDGTENINSRAKQTPLTKLNKIRRS